MALIHIVSIPRDTATKISEFRSEVSGKKLNKTKMGKATDRRCALWDDRVGGLANGLTNKPWLDENGQQKKDSNGKPLTLQDMMEQKWNKPPGFFTNKVWKQGDPVSEKDATYFQTKY